MMPLITIITATWNSSKTLQRLADSLKSQNCQDFEWLIVDGGSKDGTQDIITRNQDLVKWWISEPDQGVYDAWNKAIPHARGRWIVFVGSDDTLIDEDAVASARNFLSQTKSQILYGKILHQSAQGSFAPIGKEFSAAQFSLQMNIPHPATFHHRNFFTELGLFDSSYRIAGDYECLLRHHARGGEFAFSDFFFVRMYTGGLSTNFGNYMKIINEIKRARASHGFTERSMPLSIACKNFIKFHLYKIGIRIPGKIPPC